ncbi:MAG: hypothetical protein HYU51_13735 [Candidatus Rokubacteria bacterium]|nr:hypothetical protein [Candidatus Rokubacteria bacterium]
MTCARDRRGIALPMALMTLCMLATLSAVFATLARTEPVIATNHLRSAQARLMADSGLERALWALTNATAPGAFGGTGTPPNVVVNAAAAAPYDGSSFIRLGPEGGFFVMVSGSDQHVRVVRSIGWSPHGEGPGTRTSSTSRVVASVARVRNVPREAVCAVCTGTTVGLTSAVTVDARGSDASDCGAKAAVAASADVVFGASARLFGAGAAPGESAANVEGRDWLGSQAVPSLTDEDLDTLKALAATRGGYRRPPSDGPFELTDVRDGLVFVDTPAGTNALAPTNRAVVAIRPGFAAQVPFRGWIVVNGDVSLEGHFGEIAGLVYAANAVSAADSGGSRITGMIVAAGRLGAPASILGNLSVAFDCTAARGSSLLPSGWFVRPGAYCDRPTGC